MKNWLAAVEIVVRKVDVDEFELDGLALAPTDEHEGDLTAVSPGIGELGESTVAGFHCRPGISQSCRRYGEIRARRV